MGGQLPRNLIDPRRAPTNSQLHTSHDFVIDTLTQEPSVMPLIFAGQRRI